MKKLFEKLRSNKGFTLIEMIVVMAIIGILVALLAPNVATLIKDAQDTANDAKAKNVMTTLAAYNTKHIKDGYTFNGSGPADSQKMDLDGKAGDEYMIKVTADNFGSQMQKLWKMGTTVSESPLEYIGGANAYLPANTLTGDDVMYIYLSGQGNVLAVSLVAGDTTVKSVAGNLASGTALTLPTGATWTNGSLRDGTTDGKAYKAAVTTPTPTP